MDFSVFTSNTTVIDKRAWTCFLLGFNVQQAIASIEKIMTMNAASAAGASNSLNNAVGNANDSGPASRDDGEGSRPPLSRNSNSRYSMHSTTAAAATTLGAGPAGNRDALAQVVITQYRNFEMIEHFLTHPKTLGTQLIFTLSSTTRSTLISSYYRVDSRICRELLGKKLTHRIRKDLDDIAFRTHRSLLLCRRVFDNMKRITKKVEDAEEEMVPCIMNHFLLSQELACQYAHIIFMNHYRFDTTKRKLSLLGFADYEYAASILLQHFPASPSSALEELDSSIVEDSRLLKIALFNHKDVLEKLRLALLQQLQQEGVSIGREEGGGEYAFVEKCSFPVFKTLIRNILAIGSSLSNSKEIRDLFLTIVERIVDVCVSNGWTEGDLALFVQGLLSLLHRTGVVITGDFGGVAKYAKTFGRLFSAVQLVAVRFMQSLAV